MRPRPTHEHLPTHELLGDSVTAAINIPVLLRGAVRNPAEILLVVDFPGTQRVIAVKDGEVVDFGRGDECDVLLTSDRVSRRHARFECIDGVLSVTDLGSRNGTLVNGRKIDRATLADNALVLIGSHGIAVHYPWDREQRTETLSEYLIRMPALHAVAKAAGPDYLANIKVFLVHHLTSEVLGLIAALRAMGCRDLETLFVVYAGEVPEAYLQALRGLPDEEFHCAALTNHPVKANVEGAYEISNRFSPIRNRAEVRAALAAQPLRYFDAMQRLAVVRFFAQLERAESAGQRCVVIEDGGYLAPFLNDVALAGLAVQDVRSELVDPRRISEILDRGLIGTIEHTRSGHDRVVAVEQRHRRLARPAISIAVSNYKTQVEPRDVAATVINGVENVLHMIGKTLSRRHCVVLGSRGAVGESLVRCLQPRLLDPATQLAGVDPRVCGPRSTLLEAPSLVTLPPETRQAMDLVVGAVGRSSLSPADVET
ncbi:MAG: FHA domain-containing protein [Kofleriaceae bacterium]